MASQNNTEGGAPGADQLPDLQQWTQLLSLFSKIIGSNITLLTPDGTALLASTHQTPLCSELEPTALPRNIVRSDCLYQVLPHLRESQETFYVCPHMLQYSGIEVSTDGKTLAGIVLGPILVGKRESDESYAALCERTGVAPELFLDLVRGMKVYSYLVVRSMLVFLREMTRFYIRMNDQCAQLRHFVPALLARPEQFAFAVYSEDLANHLLDVGMQLVQADTGSVLFFDEKDECFWVKTARGMDAPVFKQSKSYLRKGLAGWAALRGKPVLIDHQSVHADIGEQLKRPQIVSSILVPLRFGARILGVLCLNALSSNLFFNKDSLLRLNQLCQLAAAALGRPDYQSA